MIVPLPPLIDRHRPQLARAIEAMPSAQHLGLRVIGFGDGVSAMEMPIRREATFDGRHVQGGVLGTLADYAAVSAATAAAPEGSIASTTGYTVQIIAPAAGERLVAVGRVIGGSRSQASAAADVYAVTAEDAVLVATSLANCRVVEPA